MSGGCFIAIEGGEGAGKSRVRAALAEGLRGAGGREVVETREPGGTKLGEEIRGLVLSHAVGDALAELLLFEAARAHLVRTVIRPALDRGAIVLCDRFAASSIAYQAYGRGLDRAIVERANAIATGGLAADLTLLLDLPPKAGLARRGDDGDENRFEREEIAFHERVRAGYLELARAVPERWRIIDASAPVAAVVEACMREVSAVMGAAPRG